MMKHESAFWTDETSVLFTSLWDWSPETWGTVGWTGDRGRTRRSNLLRELRDPFITVCYVTSNKSENAPALKGKIAGFYLVSHEIGDRDEFTHPIHHARSPDKWRHSLRAVRAFSFLPEHRLSVAELDPDLLTRARTVAAMGELLTNPAHIARLRETPWIEVDVYVPARSRRQPPITSDDRALVRAGPASKAGYEVSQGTHELPRELYVLRLEGDTAAYLGRSTETRSIYKVGLSVSPEMRRQTHQKSMPRGAFEWALDRTSGSCGLGACVSFEAAVAGEDAMKQHLARSAEWLGGEFYLATDDAVDSAWRNGLETANSFRLASLDNSR